MEEVEDMMSSKMMGAGKDEDEDDEPLPGFRFHPTDEELVGFYLRRKIEKRPPTIDHLIKQLDIYKYDPWDLPIIKSSNHVMEKEGYFFCKRGRKYRNSVRPNRVTSSGFWKATGIDKPIYSSGAGDGGMRIIGLKKSLVYYRGSAGKGTKTDWMMHEFRLPPPPAAPDYKSITSNMDVANKTIGREAEVWTLCRILKRKKTDHHRKLMAARPDWREAVAKRNNSPEFESSDNKKNMIKFAALHRQEIETKTYSYANTEQDFPANFSSFSTLIIKSPAPASCGADHINDYFLRRSDINNNNNWDDLQSIVDCATAPFTDPFYL